VKKLLTSLVLGTLACASTNREREIGLSEQTSYPTIFIENGLWEPLALNIISGSQFNSRFDNLGEVPAREKKCFEIKQEGNITIVFSYHDIMHRSLPFNSRAYGGGHRVKIGARPEEDIMAIEPSRKCHADVDYNHAEF